MPLAVVTLLNRRQGRGTPLPPDVESGLGSAFGADLSSVRVHVGEEPAGLARRVQAKAFSYGNDLYFSPGAYRPYDRPGRAILAHEIAHVLLEDRPRSGAPVIGMNRDESEAQADRLAHSALLSPQHPRESRSHRPAPRPGPPGVLRRLSLGIIELDTPNDRTAEHRSQVMASMQVLRTMRSKQRSEFLKGTHRVGGPAIKASGVPHYVHVDQANGKLVVTTEDGSTPVNELEARKSFVGKLYPAELRKYGEDSTVHATELDAPETHEIPVTGAENPAARDEPDTPGAEHPEGKGDLAGRAPRKLLAVLTKEYPDEAYHLDQEEDPARWKLLCHDGDTGIRLLVGAQAYVRKEIAPTAGSHVQRSVFSKLGGSGAREYVTDERGVHTRRYAFVEKNFWQLMDLLATGGLTGRRQTYQTAFTGAAVTRPDLLKDLRTSLGPNAETSQDGSAEAAAPNGPAEQLNRLAFSHVFLGNGLGQRGLSLTSSPQRPIWSNDGESFREELGARLTVDLARVPAVGGPLLLNHHSYGSPDFSSPPKRQSSEPAGMPEETKNSKLLPDGHAKFDFPNTVRKNSELYLEYLSADWITAITLHLPAKDYEVLREARGTAEFLTAVADQIGFTAYQQNVLGTAPADAVAPNGVVKQAGDRGAGVRNVLKKGYECGPVNLGSYQWKDIENVHGILSSVKRELRRLSAAGSVPNDLSKSLASIISGLSEPKVRALLGDQVLEFTEKLVRDVAPLNVASNQLDRARVLSAQSARKRAEARKDCDTRGLSSMAVENFLKATPRSTKDLRDEIFSGSGPESTSERETLWQNQLALLKVRKSIDEDERERQRVTELGQEVQTALPLILQHRTEIGEYTTDAFWVGWASRARGKTFEEAVQQYVNGFRSAYPSAGSGNQVTSTTTSV